MFWRLRCGGAAKTCSAPSMDFLQVFLGEVVWQSAVALEAMTQLREALAQPPSPSGNNRAFFHIQAFLVAAANVSKLLWPSGNRKRGNELRRLLSVTEDSPIANRTLRNHFEHFDERIDSWTTKSKHHMFIDRTILVGPTGPEYHRGGIVGVAPTD